MYFRIKQMMIIIQYLLMKLPEMNRILWYGKIIPLYPTFYLCIKK